MYFLINYNNNVAVSATMNNKLIAAQQFQWLLNIHFYFMYLDIIIDVKTDLFSFIWVCKYNLKT